MYDWWNANEVCPFGWHLPSGDEWSILRGYLGGEDIAGGKLKQTGTSLWLSPNTDATNSSGFTALPGGQWQGFDGNFILLGQGAYFWTCDEMPEGYSEALYFFIRYNTGEGSFGIYDLVSGYSVRCVKN